MTDLFEQLINQVVTNQVFEVGDFEAPIGLPCRIVEGKLVFHVNDKTGPLLPALGSPKPFDAGGFKFASIEYTEHNVGLLNAHCNVLVPL